MCEQSRLYPTGTHGGFVKKNEAKRKIAFKMVKIAVKIKLAWSSCKELRHGRRVLKESAPFRSFSFVIRLNLS